MLEIVVGGFEKCLLEKTELFKIENIIDISLLLCMGEIKGIKTTNTRCVCDYIIDVKNRLDKLKQKAVKAKNIRIWYCSLDNEDVCALYFTINYLSDIEDLNIYICDSYNEKYFSLCNYPITEINNLLDKAKKLTKKEKEFYKNSWDDLEKENAELRVVHNNKLESYSFDYLYSSIIELLKKYDSISYYEFVGECLKLKMCGFYVDVVFIIAIDYLIDCGRIEVCEIRQEKNIRGELANKKYIRVSCENNP